MTTETLPDETEYRRFFLGEMTEAERTAFEEKFLVDEGLFEQIRVVEDELIESYVRGHLSADETEKFESTFLSTDSRRRRVAFTRSMFDRLAGQEYPIAVEKSVIAVEDRPARSSWLDLFRTPKFAFGAALSIMLLVVGGWLLLKAPAVPEPEIARQTTPTPKSGTDQNTLGGSNNNVTANVPENKNTPSNASTPKPAPAIPTPILALFAGNVRSGGKMPELDLPENAAGAQLQLNLESQDYKVYMVEIDDPDGNAVVRQDHLTAKTSKINLFVPTKNLRMGDYIVKLSGLNQQNVLESVADFPFRVKR